MFKQKKYKKTEFGEDKVGFEKRRPTRKTIITIIRQKMFSMNTFVAS